MSSSDKESWPAPAGAVPDVPAVPRSSVSETETADVETVLKPIGVLKVEAAEAVWNKKTKWILFISLGVAAYVYSLDGMTTYLYNSFAWSELGQHSSLGTVQTANSIIIAVGKPFWAKFADTFGRGEVFVALAVFYAVGYAIIAGAHNAGAMYAGQVIYTCGYTGLQVMQQIIVADLTTLRWRGFVSSLLTFWFIINAFIAGEISTGMLAHSTWRWGYGMFAILMPATLLPLMTTLLWAQWKGKKILKRRGVRALKEPFFARLKRALQEMDFIGLVLVGTSLALILLTFGLVYKAKNEWKNPSMIAMLVVGCVLFPVFIVYEWKVPARPVVPIRWLRQLTILGSCLIGFFDFVSFYLQFTYLYSYVFVTQDFSQRNLTYFSYTQTLCLTFFGIVAGIIMATTRRYKWMLVAGLLIRLLGCGLMLHARGPNGNVASLVMCQVLQGAGGGFAATSILVGPQAVVRHADVATVIAMVLLITEVGNSVGSAAATGLWQQHMPKELATYVPTNNGTLLTEIFGDITIIKAMPITDPIRMGAITAYQHMMHKLVLGAVVVAVFPPIFAVFLMKDIRLSDAQNAHDGKDTAGNTIEEPEQSYRSEKEEALKERRQSFV